jgi:hypothetical protein
VLEWPCPGRPSSKARRAHRPLVGRLRLSPASSLGGRERHAPGLSRSTKCATAAGPRSTAAAFQTTEVRSISQASDLMPCWPSWPLRTPSTLKVARSSNYFALRPRWPAQARRADRGGLQVHDGEILHQSHRHRAGRGPGHHHRREGPAGLGPRPHRRGQGRAARAHELPGRKVTAELLQLTEDSSIDRTVVDRILAT